MKNTLLILNVILLTFSSLLSQPVELQGPTGIYFDQKPPGNKPIKFPFDYMPPGYRLHSAPVFIPNGSELYFSAMDFSIQFSEKIFVMRMIDNKWTSPQIAKFSGYFFDGSPSIS